MDVPFFNLWGILNIDRIKLVHITESEELRIPERYLHDPSTDADGFVPKTIGRSRTNYVRFILFTLRFNPLLTFSVLFRFACFWTKWFRASTPL